MIKFIKKLFKKYKSQQERFELLSSKDKLEYYTKFEHTPFKFISWYSYIILFLISIIIEFTMYILYSENLLSVDQMQHLIIILFAIFKIMLMLISFEITFGLVMLAIFYYQKNKWLKDKGVKR